MKKTSFALLALAAALPVHAAHQITVPSDSPNGPRYITRFQAAEPYTPAPATHTFNPYALSGENADLTEDGSESLPIFVELGASYNFATNDIMKKAHWGSSPTVHTGGVDLTTGVEVAPGHNLMLRVGYATGSHAYRDEEWKDDFRVHQLTLMPGYRYSKPLAGSLSCYAGVYAGITNESVKEKTSDAYESDRMHGSAFGFGYAAELGVSFELSHHMHLSIGYQFSGSTAQPKLRDADSSYKTARQYYHSVRAGLNYCF